MDTLMTNSKAVQGALDMKLVKLMTIKYLSLLNVFTLLHILLFYKGVASFTVYIYFRLPEPNLNGLQRIPNVISDAIALAIVIFAISISMGKLLAKKHDYEVDANQV